ncbi:MAG: OmpA family protein [Acidobacteriaceae bacterium]
MFERPYGFIGRVILAACAVSLGVSSLSAQSTTTTKSAVPDSSISKADIFTGYSYYGTHGENKPSAIKFSSIDLGAIGSFAYYFNKYAGAEAEFASHPDGQNDGLTTISAGPIFRLPLQDMTPFVHGLVGAARLGGPNSDMGGYHNPYRWGTALTLGGGLDYGLPFFNHKLGLRLFQADYQYVHASFGPAVAPPTGGAIGGRANLSSAQLSTGLLFHLGSIAPPPPVTYTCAASPSSVYPGDPITVTGTAENLNPKKTATYTWTTDGGKISGTSNVANIDTANAEPGSYTAKGHVTEGAKAGQSADCSAAYTVKAYEPPTISCSANPSTVKPGDSSTITAQGVSPQNRPLTYSYSASAGTVSGSGTTATLSTTGAAPGTITVTCNVVDDKGHTASATTEVTVEAPPPPPAPQAQQLCSINFDRDHRRPTRVDNEAKACLDDVALSLQRSADAKAVLVASSTDKEKKMLKRRSRHADVNKLAEERAVNTKAYLTKEKGIDPSRIELFTGSDNATTVQNTLVPAGASFDTSTLTPVDEAKFEVHHRQVHHHVKKK